MMDRAPQATEGTLTSNSKLKKWDEEFSVKDWQKKRITLSQVYDLEALDVPPLINDRCKGEIWQEACTKLEFQNYVETELWKRHPELSSIFEWHEMIELVIDSKGKVARIFTVIRQGEECKVCDKIIEKIILDMPLWNPGVQDGKAVKTRLILPFSTFSVS